jgi:hypothetical protein
MPGLFPLSRMQQFDSNGKLLSGARLFLFEGGTDTPISGFKDSSLSTPHTNPILADSAGRLPLIYLDDGFYRQRLTTASGLLIFDDDGIPVLSSTDGTSGTTVNPDKLYKTRDIKIRLDDQPISGYVRLNGRTIGSALSGASERANLDTQSLFEELWPYCAVTGGKGASAAADFAANKPLVLPDAAGRSIFGLDDMGAGAKGRLPGVIVPGSVTGAATYTLLQANMPSYTLTGTASGAISTSGTTSAASNDHFHSVSGATSWESNDHTHGGGGNTGGMNVNAVHSHGVSGGYIASNSVGFGLSTGGTSIAIPNSNVTINNANIDHVHAFGFTTSGVSANHSHTFNVSSGGISNNHTHTFTGTGSASLSASIASGGSSTAFSLIPPAMVFTIYVSL